MNKTQKYVWRAYAVYFLVSMIIWYALRDQVAEFARGDRLASLRDKLKEL